MTTKLFTIGAFLVLTTTFISQAQNPTSALSRDKVEGLQRAFHMKWFHIEKAGSGEQPGVTSWSGRDPRTATQRELVATSDFIIGNPPDRFWMIFPLGDGKVVIHSRSGHVISANSAGVASIIPFDRQEFLKTGGFKQRWHLEDIEAFSHETRQVSKDGTNNPKNVEVFTGLMAKLRNEFFGTYLNIPAAVKIDYKPGNGTTEQANVSNLNLVAKGQANKFQFKVVENLLFWQNFSGRSKFWIPINEYLAFDYWDNQGRTPIHAPLMENSVRPSGVSFTPSYLTGAAFRPFFLMDPEILKLDQIYQGSGTTNKVPNPSAFILTPYYIIESWEGYTKKAKYFSPQSGAGSLGFTFTKGWSRSEASSFSQSLGTALTVGAEGGLPFGIATVKTELTISAELGWTQETTKSVSGSESVTHSFTTYPGRAMQVYQVNTQIRIRPGYVDRVVQVGGSRRVPRPSEELFEKHLVAFDLPQASYVARYNPELPENLLGRQKVIGSWLESPGGATVSISIDPAGPNRVTIRRRREPSETTKYNWTEGSGTFDPQRNELTCTLNGKTFSAIFKKANESDRFGEIKNFDKEMVGVTWEQYAEKAKKK